MLITYYWVPYATHEAHWLAPSHTAYCTGCEVIKSQPVTVKLQWNRICSFINTCIKCSPCNNCHAQIPHRKTSYNVYGLQVTSYDWDNKKTGRWCAVENVNKIGARLKDLTSTAHQCVWHQHTMQHNCCIYIHLGQLQFKNPMTEVTKQKLNFVKSYFKGAYIEEMNPIHLV